jgi:hypothetical protein
MRVFEPHVCDLVIELAARILLVVVILKDSALVQGHRGVPLICGCGGSWLDCLVHQFLVYLQRLVQILLNLHPPSHLRNLLITSRLLLLVDVLQRRIHHNLGVIFMPCALGLIPWLLLVTEFLLRTALHLERLVVEMRRPCLLVTLILLLLLLMLLLLLLLLIAWLVGALRLVPALHHSQLLHIHLLLLGHIVDRV